MYVLATARWLPVKSAAVVAAALLLAGRWLAMPWASALGAVLVLAVALWTRQSARACARSGAILAGFPRSLR